MDGGPRQIGTEILLTTSNNLKPGDGDGAIKDDGTGSGFLHSAKLIKELGQVTLISRPSDFRRPFVVSSCERPSFNIDLS